MSDHVYIHTYDEADDLWSNTRRRKLQNNTYLVRSIGWYGIKLHNTVIVKYRRNDDIILDSGGWKTPTTKNRMNDYQNRVNVWQEKGLWFVSKPGRWDRKDRIPYSDGMILSPNGCITTEPQEVIKELLALRKRAKSFAKSYMEAFDAGDVPAPSAGDCLYCQCVEEETGRPVQQRDHIVSHMDENYYVPSLLLRATEEFPVAPIAHHWLGMKWGFVEFSPVLWAQDIARDQLRKSLTRHLYRQLGLPS